MHLVAKVCTCLVALNAFARLVPHKDPADGVLDAELVVVARQSPGGEPGLFSIEEMFLGNQHVGDSIDLGGFKLSITQEHGPDIVDPIGPSTRILLFLQRVKNSPAQWEPTYFKESFFWVQRPEDVGLLRRAAERAVELRQQWENAASISDPKQRVVALWPYLSISTYGVSFFNDTDSELQRAAPAAGQYFAKHFDGMSHNERMSLLAKAGAYGGKALHQKLREYLEQQERAYEKYSAASGKPPKDIDWNTMPANLQDATGEIYYGLAGLARFRDRNDLPFIRLTALWAANYHLEQTASAALDAFRDMPDQANLPAIERILREFLPGRKPGVWNIDWDAERALCEHKYPETVPLLAPFVAEDAMTVETESCLGEIVGRDLGRSPKPWLDWYTTAHSSAPAPPTAPN